MLDDLVVSKTLVIAPLRVARDTWPAEVEKWDHLSALDVSVIIRIGQFSLVRWQRGQLQIRYSCSNPFREWCAGYPIKNRLNARFYLRQAVYTQDRKA